MSLSACRPLRLVTPFALVALAAACHHHPHDEAGGHAHDEHGHGHGHDDHGAPDPDERPGLAYTLWSDRHELFSENDALAVGLDSAFAAHVTLVPSFRPATEGALTVTLVQSDGSEVEVTADAPRNPGIFRPVLRPTKAGACKLTVTIRTAGAPDVMELPGCVVHADAAAAREAAPEEAEDPSEIGYLKEQQWKTDFAMLRVAEQDLQPTLRAIGDIGVVPGREARLSAALAGRVVLADPAPQPGARVEAGQLLATVVPPVGGPSDRPALEAEVRTARAELDAATPALSRATRLHADGLVPRRAVDEAAGAVKVARARLAGASARLEQWEAAAKGGPAAGVEVRAPFAGTLVASEAFSGRHVQPGDGLFTLMDLGRVVLEVRVFESDLPRLGTPSDAWFSVDGDPALHAVSALNGRLASVGSVVDAVSRTVPIRFELDNPDGRLRIGQFVKVTLGTGAPVRAIAIPEAAIVQDAGRPVAYVQVHGEAFARRPLTLGLRSKGWVQVTDGLAPGEYVVTTGAWDVKLASAAGSVPAHGHAH